MTKSDVLPFVAPFFLFAVFLSVQGFLPGPTLRALSSCITVMRLAATIIAWFWRSLPSLKPSSPLVSIGVGIVGVVLWVGLDPFLVRYDQPLLGRNPFALYPASVAWILFGFRVAGIAVCMPIMEELFWRGFLMRWLIKEDFTSVPLGSYQPLSFWATTAFLCQRARLRVAAGGDRGRALRGVVCPHETPGRYHAGPRCDELAPGALLPRGRMTGIFSASAAAVPLHK